MLTRERTVITNKQKQMAEHLLEAVASVNPYSKQGTNAKQEYNIYQGGFLAGYLASLMEEDPFVYRRFMKHIEQRRVKPFKRG